MSPTNTEKIDEALQKIAGLVANVQALDDRETALANRQDSLSQEIAELKKELGRATTDRGKLNQKMTELGPVTDLKSRLLVVERNISELRRARDLWI